MEVSKSNIILTVGIPTSGKSTWAKQYILDNPNTVRFNRDDMRVMLNGSYTMNTETEFMITKLMHQAILDAVHYKKDIIIDETNLKIKYIKEFVEKYQYIANIKFKVFHISLEDALERNKNRAIVFDKDVFIKMYDRYSNLIKNYDFIDIEYKPSVIIHPTYNTELKDCVIIDTTDCLLSFGEYKLNKYMDEQVRLHLSKGRHVIFVSSQYFSDFDIVYDIISKYYNIDKSQLYMRDNDSQISEYNLKKGIIDSLIDKFNIVAYYDDKVDIVNKLYFNYGINAIRVNVFD